MRALVGPGPVLVAMPAIIMIMVVMVRRTGAVIVVIVVVAPCGQNGYSCCGKNGYYFHIHLSEW
ncbi:hypothetical protein CXU22_06605 [Akkermansia muciniphila]|uniref:Uncharacterized protein n=1 Tax=Akkermansia muciniphila TaxID=239935 RepID=A0A2N8HE93_9BACT|nr:hypothetical protein CXU22_06605 [Akkermansia muciniphila]